MMATRRAAWAMFNRVSLRPASQERRAAREAGVRCCVLLSSVKAMGEGGVDVLDEDAPCAPQNPYGATKLTAERIVLEELPLPCPVVLRPTLVYGAGSAAD